jgi:hypothetical protein
MRDLSSNTRTAKKSKIEIKERFIMKKIPG